MIKQIAHLEARPVGIEARRGPLAVPSPLLLELWREVFLKHLDNILSKDGEKLETVEVAAGGDVQALCRSMRRDDEVGRCGERVPTRFVSE